MLSERILANLFIALDAVMANKLRSMLTALGIIFGVAAVIAMLAIGTGAQQEILEQIRLVGVNNIVIQPIVEQTEETLGEQSTEEEKTRFSPGLTQRDVIAIRQVVPGITRLSPEIVLDTYIIKSGIRRSAKLVGVRPEYFELTDFSLAEGNMFTDHHLTHGEPVCIIGKSIRSRFFPTENPVGKQIKVGNIWLTVIGVLEERLISQTSISKLGIRDFNMDVYAPIQTVLIRFVNRDRVSKEALGGGRVISRGRGGMMIQEEQTGETRPTNYHQIDRLVVQVEDTDRLSPVAEVISRLLERRHNNVIDFEITIPELLLKQQQRTNQIFNFVLGAIAGISLLVGGIGIMNIMLASVLERIKEIGLRMSIGAKKLDIVYQFLFEAVFISVTGGIMGVIIGVSLALLISNIAEIPTIITFSSILLSFGVAATVGLVFGITPARRAASQDPIASLRYE